MKSRIKKIINDLSTMTFSVIVFFVISNFILSIYYSAKDVWRAWKYAQSHSGEAQDSAGAPFFYPDGRPVFTSKRLDYQLRAFNYNSYTGADPAYVSDVLDDFYELVQEGLVFQPWTEYAEPLYDGKRLHVDRDEFGILSRRTVNPPNAEGRPVVRIFALGGSTTFGYNVSDEHTWPTQLSWFLNQRAEETGLDVHVEVLNYGRCYYYPTLELVQLIELLKNGHRPGLVLFMDGVNPGGKDDTPFFFPEFARRFKMVQSRGAFLKESLSYLPLTRFLLAAKNWVSGEEKRRIALEQTLEEGNGAYYVTRFKKAQEMSESMCRLYGVECLFFLQPNVFYGDEFANPPSNWKMAIEAIYGTLQKDKKFIYLGDLFDKWGKDRRKAVIDDVHYSPAFNQFLAQEVASHIDLKKLAKRAGSPLIDYSQSTRTLDAFAK